MSDDRQRDHQPRELVGVIHVDGAIFRIDRTPVALARHGDHTTLTFPSARIRQIGKKP